MTQAVKSPLALRAPHPFEASCVPELRHTIRSKSGSSEGSTWD